MRRMRTPIITLILAGKYLEATAKGRTSAAIRKLVELQPKSARVESGGQVIEIPVAEVAPGNRVNVRPGEVRNNLVIVPLAGGADDVTAFTLNLDDVIVASGKSKRAATRGAGELAS